MDEFVEKVKDILAKTKDEAVAFGLKHKVSFIAFAVGLVLGLLA